MKSSIFKNPKNMDEIFDFFKDRELLEQPDFTDIFENLENVEHKFFEISSPGDAVFVAQYNDNDELKTFEKDFRNNIYVNYLVLVKNDFSEYVFIKNDEGTGKMLRLRKKVGDLNAAFLRKLDKLEYDNFEVFESIFDRSDVIKQFYDYYCYTEEYLIKNIKGIPDEEDKEHFAKLIIQRIMFLWFLQKKGFLDDEKNYFITKFIEINSNTNNYYKDFLQKLFFTGLCKKEDEREEFVTQLIGDVPYLNGGLFIESEIELKYGNSIEISNNAFFRTMNYPIQDNERNIPVLNLMDCKDWTVDERSGEVDKLDPEVLGYIFEKSINQKDLGAVYTPEEITNYICKNTIYSYLIDNLNKKFGTNFVYKANINTEFLDQLNRDQLKYLSEIITEMKILDPAVGSGHFLVDAIVILEKIYLYLSDAGIIDCNKFQIRHYIITESLFGVDLLPGAVEICKLRLFLALAETFKMKRDVEPLPNIEFNIRCGNSLIGFSSASQLDQNFISSGPIINTLNRYIAFLRNHAPKVAEQGEKILLTFKTDFKIEPFTLFKLRTDLVKIYRNLHDHDLQTEFRAVLYDITEAFNYELNSQFLKRILPVFDKKKELKKLKDRDKVKFYNSLHPFHWLMEFSEIFETCGFPLVVGNPPWDIVKPIEKEFFSKYDPQLTKYGVNKKDAKIIINRLLKNPKIACEWYNYKILKILEGTYYSKSGDYKFQSDIVNGRTVSGDPNLYKLFIERFYQLESENGYSGIVTPSGFYTDAGSKGLRKLMFDNTTVKEMYCFENRKGIFDSIHKSFKFIILLSKKTSDTQKFKAAFMLHEVSVLKNIDTISLEIPWNLIKRLSAESYSVIEFKNRADLAIVEKMYKIPTLGEYKPKSLTSELHMTNDSHLFNTAKNGLILYEGKMIEQYICDFEKPQYWVKESKALERLGSSYKDYNEHRLAFRAVASSTNRRSMISTILPKRVFVGNSLTVTKILNGDERLISSEELLYFCGILNTFILDYLIRMKITTNLNMFFIYELPIPPFNQKENSFNKIVENVAKLICVSEEFDELKDEIGIKPIKNDKKNRMKLIAEIERITKELFNLNNDELEHILDSFHQRDDEVEKEMDELKIQILKG